VKAFVIDPIPGAPFVKTVASLLYVGALCTMGANEKKKSIKMLFQINSFDFDRDKIEILVHMANPRHGYFLSHTNYTTIFIGYFIF
jgi:hypothetical protein